MSSWLDRVGYACINTALRYSDPPVFTARTVRARNFSLEKASFLALENSRDLLKIIRWNQDNNIRVFRVGSDVFPRWSAENYKLSQLPDYAEIFYNLSQAGQLADSWGHQLTTHPSHFVVLSSDNPETVKIALREINQHSEFLGILNPNLNIPINIHVGGNFKKENDGAKRFINNFKRLSPDSQGRLILENDNKVNGWSVPLLYKYIYEEIGVPITYDYHHACFTTDSSMLEYEYHLAKSTWEDNRLIEVHYSESSSLDKLDRKHSELVSGSLPDFIISDEENYYYSRGERQRAGSIRVKRKI